MILFQGWRLVKKGTQALAALLFRCLPIDIWSPCVWAPRFRRAARCGKAALLALKYIVTHELTGVLQPIVHSVKSNVYLPKRQLQKCLMMLLFICMISMTMSTTLCLHRTYMDTTSTMSHMVMPLVISTDMSTAITRLLNIWFVRLLHEHSHESIFSDLTSPIF